MNKTAQATETGHERVKSDLEKQLSDAMVEISKLGAAISAAEQHREAMRSTQESEEVRYLMGKCDGCGFG